LAEQLEMGEDRTPLHWAATNGDLKALNELLGQGDDPDVADDCGWTPLITAASCGYSHIAAALLQAGTNAKRTTKEGRSAFFYAVSRCHMPVIDLFIQNDIIDWRKDKNGSNPVHRAICNAKCTLPVLEMLKEAGAEFDIPDGEGNLPIHLACYENRKDIVQWLIEKASASLKNPKNHDGKVPGELLPSSEFNA
jgi:26S proteasome non-ATPase regulatory subunit 10